MGWANRITLGRAVLTMALWAVIAAAGPDPATSTWWIAFVMFVVTAATDAVDGIVARRLGEVSVFGRIADPLVDKLLVLGTMTVLLGVDGIEYILPPWAVTLIVAREVIVTALRGAVEGRGVSFQAAASGKGKMILQCIAVGAVLVHGAGLGLARAGLPGLENLDGGAARWNIAFVLVLAATALTVWSAVDYTRRAVRILRT